jgi:putative methyltransferase (TIGR04325 family)
MATEVKVRRFLYPVLRMVRRFLYFTTPKRIQSYNSQNLAEKILRADLDALDERASFGCQLWKLDLKVGNGLRVLDFGGGSGRCGFEEVGGLASRWAVVETSEMTTVANHLYSQPGLSFFDSIEQAKTWLGKVDALHVSSALQYTDSPLETLRALLNTNPRIVVFEKLVVSTASAQRFLQYSFLRDNLGGRSVGVARQSGSVRYWLFAESEAALFEALGGASYEIVQRWEDPIQSHLPLGKGLRQIGFVAKKTRESFKNALQDA